MEAGSKLGFSVAIGSASRCTYEQYCTVFTKWHDKITKVALHSLSHYKDHGRACLLVLIKLIGVYPIYKHVSTQLLGLLEAIQVQEDMKDVQAMAKRYCTLCEVGGYTGGRISPNVIFLALKLSSSPWHQTPG